MTPERLEEIREVTKRHAGLGILVRSQTSTDREDLLAEVDRLRAVLTRIVDDPLDAHHHARRALEGTP